MSLDYYSMTCIGLKVPREKIIAEETEFKNHCSCTPQTTPNCYPDAKYCSDCGNPIKRPIKVNKPLFDGFTGDWYNEEVKLRGWVVAHDGGARNFFICIFNTGIVEEEKKSALPLIAEETLAKFNTDMRELGLWDKDQFGLWTITFCH